MATAAGSVIILAGAPHASGLKWDAQDGESDTLCRRFRRYLGNIYCEDDASPYDDGQAPPSQPLAKWREVALQGALVEPEQGPQAPPLTSLHASHSVEPDQEHLHFLEYSLAVLENLESSQIAPASADASAYDETAFVSGLSFTSDLTTSFPTSASASLCSNVSDEHAQQVIQFTGQITDLKRVPTARHLESIHPQTMTINALVGVIAVQPARTVRLRKRVAEMDIIEVLVGDETRAGFSISFWLPPTDSARSTVSRPEGRSALAAVLEEMRSGHVILISNIALSTFKNNVYGQSLSRRITRNNTSLVNLAVDPAGLSVPLMAKLRRVQEWTSTFVGRSLVSKRAASPVDPHSSQKHKRQSVLPPDSQADT